MILGLLRFHHCSPEPTVPISYPTILVSVNSAVHSEINDLEEYMTFPIVGNTSNAGNGGKLDGGKSDTIPFNSENICS